jgi:hypothetical protein
MKKNIGDYNFAELDDPTTQAMLIEESLDPEFMELLFGNMNRVRKDSLNPEKE